MVVYGEMLFMENAIIGAVLLYLTGNICGMGFSGKCEKIRLLTGSVMCGMFSLIIFIDTKVLWAVLMEGIFACIVCTVVFGTGNVDIRRSGYQALIFILITYFMGGITMGMLLLANHKGIYTAMGIYTGDMKAAVLAVFVVIGFVTVRHVIKTVKKNKLYTEHSYKVKIVIGSVETETDAFFDTGNRLKEPITGKPAAVASEELWHRISKNGHMGTEGIDDEVRFSIIPYESIGSRGLLNAVRTDYVEIEGRQIKGCYIACGGKEFALDGHDLLLPAEMTAAKLLKGER